MADAYQQVKVLGKGSFGAAWLVKRRKDGAQFVAKEVKLGNMKQHEKDEAKNEITMLRNLAHPNITRYVDHYETRGSLFIVMEYANGGDLYTKIQSRRGVRMPEKDVLHYFCQLSLALYHMHEKRILHRDLKTQNVFLTADGVVKLGDFGISTVLRNTYELKRTQCGTPYYFSPELCMNKPYNNKSDIWALGCILYELTTLNHAFDATSMKALMQRILRGVYPPIHTSYSKELRDLIASMLQIDPHKRPHIAAVVQQPFMRTAMQALQQDTRQANQEKRSIVDEDQRKKEKEEALRRAEAEKVARAKREAEHKAQQADREKAHAERVQRMREQMQREVREHEDKMKAIREEQKVKDERRQAEQAERQKRMDEERKLRERRKGEIEAANRKREAEWEKNMKNAKEDADRRAQQQEAANAARAYQMKQDEERQQQRQAAAFNDARQAARANRERAAEDERREREQRYAAAQQQRAATPPDELPPVGKPKPAAYDKDQARDAYFEMRRQAAENRARIDDERRAQQQQQGPSAPAHPASAPAGDAPQQHQQQPARQRTPQQKDEKAEAAQRAEAFWEMRRAAEENRRRLMGLDPAPPAAGAADHQPPASAPAAAPAPKPQPAPKPRTPPVEPIVPPAVQQRRATPPAEPPARMESPVDANVPSDDDDADGDVGYHKFLNNDAAAEVDGPSSGDKANHNASRQADYEGMNDDISKILEAQGPGADFEDTPESLGHFQLDGRTLELPNTNMNDPLGHRIETLRMFLEKSMGEDNFFAIYRLLSRDDGSGDNLEEQAQAIAGKSNAKYVEVVVQLIVCEEAFASEQNG